MYKRISLVFIVGLVLIMLSSGVSAIEFPNITTPYTINFSKPIKNITLLYGFNEKNNWYSFSNFTTGSLTNQNNWTLGYHRNTSSSYIRVWIYNSSVNSLYLMPYANSTGFYNYTILDQYVYAVLNTSAKPYLQFAYAPDNMSQGGKGNEKNQPLNYTDYANYIANVTIHLQTTFGNISTWYISVWNEPDCTAGSNWTTMTTNTYNYTAMFNTVYTIVKSKIGDAKIGHDFCNLYPQDTNLATGSTTDRKLDTFLQNITSIDFLAYHSYANNDIGITGINKDILNSTNNISYTIVKNIRLITDRYFPNIPVFSSEFSLNTSNNDTRVEQDYNAVYYSSSMFWMMQSNISLEMYFEGTGDSDVTGYGIWSKLTSQINKPSPAYYMKRLFVKANARGNTIYNYTQPDPMVEVIGSTNATAIFVTAINKYDTSVQFNITFNRILNTNLIDMNTSEVFAVTNNQTNLTIPAYGTRFLSASSSAISFNPASPADLATNSSANCGGVSQTLQDGVTLLIPMVIVFLIVALLISIGIFKLSSVGGMSTNSISAGMLGSIALIILVMAIIFVIGIMIVSRIPC